MLSSRLERLSNRLEKFQARLELVRNRRLVTGLITFGALVAAAVYSQAVWLQPIAFLIGPAVFFVFARQSRNLHNHITDLTHLQKFYQRQDRRQKGFPPEGKGLISYEDLSGRANDLDLINGHSLFHLIDETMSPSGQERLIQKILHPSTDATEIRKQQELIRKLSKHTWPLIRLRLIGAKSGGTDEHSHQLEDFAARSFLEDGFKRDLTILLVLSALSIFGFIQAVFWEWFHPALFPALHFVYFFAVSTKIKTSMSRALNLATQLAFLMPIFEHLETHSSSGFSDHLNKIKKFSPSKKMKSLNWVISGLSVEANPLVYVGVNAFLPWSFVFASLLEKQRLVIKDELPACIDELAEIESLIGLALLPKFQTATWPSIATQPTLNFKGLYHPLIDRSQVVANDFEQNSTTHLNLITGSNMAGKSTFLRTVGMNQVLFQMGAPVFAESFESFPFNIQSSIRVSDSLESGFSYFYAEVQRLKRILEASDQDSPTLYLIDEIFRGTNNRERLVGSQSLLTALSRTRGIGFVSTHDLELTRLADAESTIENYHFRDDVDGEQLVFSYKIQQGPCPTTNALKIMNLAGLPVPQDAKSFTE